MNSKVYYDDISSLRAFFIICIVLGHSFAIYTGGNAWPLPEGISYIDGYKYINPAAISFHLQGFVFIAGFLFGSQMSRREFGNISFIKKKAKRILLPMLLFGILYIGLFNRELFYAGQWIIILCYGPGHLWFLPMLFLCYITTKLFWRFLKHPSIFSFLTLTFISLSSWLVPTNFNPGDFLFYWVFFVLGVWFFKLKDELYIRFNTVTILFCLYVLIILLIITKCWGYYSVFTGKTPIMALVRYMLGTIGAVTMMFSFKQLERAGISLSRFRWNGWYGVYIYHQFILMILYYDLPIHLTDTWWLPFAMFIIALVSSVTLTQLSLKTKIGRFLIG